MKIGIDWGGTKIEGIAIDSSDGNELNRIRVDSPKDNYKEIISTVVSLINEMTKGISEFTVGIGQVIAGWDEAILLLNKGAAARLVIPSHLGYGAQGAGGIIPPDTTLIFDIELLDS